MRALGLLILMLGCNGSSSSASSDSATHPEDVGLLPDAEPALIEDVGVLPDVHLDEAPEWVATSHALRKFRPETPLPEGRAVTLDAARNEFEAYQLVFAGGASGRVVAGVEPGVLTGPGGATIEGNTWVYQPGLYEVTGASNSEGAVGPWPDPMIPVVDSIYGERRRGLPLRVPAGEVRALWVDLLVPPETPPGEYTGLVSLQTDVGGFDVPVSLRVRSFTLPSTSTLRSAYGMGWDHACQAHHGSYEACGADAGIEAYHRLYARAALDHRISIEQVIYTGPRGEDWSHFDQVYGDLFDGTADTRLAGAQLTAVRDTSSDEQYPLWAAHFEEKGWLDRLFNYTCDEPPNGCRWDQIPGWAEAPQRVGIRTLVTTSVDHARAEGVLPDIDILVPVIHELHPREGESTRPRYDEWLMEDPAKRMIWTYQSCQSHGCGEGCDTSPLPIHAGWPSYVIDASALQNRALEWLSYKHRVSGELYYFTTLQLTQAFEDQCAFSGSGDGTLFYPGRPDLIGGTEHIPLASMRMKLIREGMEDYEYLHLLGTLGDRAFAEEQIDALFPADGPITRSSPEDLLAARRRIADRIEALQAD